MSRTTGVAVLGTIAVAAALVGASATVSRAVYLDEGQNWALRMRAYSQFGMRLQNSRSEKVLSPVTIQPDDGSTIILDETQTVPETRIGQMVQNRFFANPELEAKLTPYLGWMQNSWLRWLAPDDLRMRVAGWGFYDGIYDYGPERFNREQKKINENFDPFVAFQTSRPDGIREGGWYIQGSKLDLETFRTASGAVVGRQFSDIFPDYELKDPRDHYAYHKRINEFYLSYTKGPLFVRAGKQSLSWGESDTIALLDQTNPFGVLLGAPGFFQDIDEARIPLWTLRTNYDIFSNIGPFSSGNVEAYWVPGDIDTEVGYSPILTASPFSPPGPDPGRGNPIFPSTYQFVFFDQIPEKKFSNSRYGFRFQTVYARFLTLQAWYYRTFPQQPVPMKIGFEPSEGSRDIQIEDSNGRRTNLFIISLQRRLTSVYGVSGTFFSETVDGIVRMNAQLFENEPGFIPDRNLNIGTPSEAVLGQGDLPRANVLRYELGYDRFFFFRPLNPSNSFVLVSSIVGFWNFDHTGEQDFRFAGIQKRGITCLDPSTGQSVTSSANACREMGLNPTQRGADIDDYVQQKRAEAQAQVTLQSDWMHGKIQPRITALAFTRGTWGLHPQLTYRFSDWLLFSMSMQWIGGDFQSLGIFQDRAQLLGRVTYQLN